MATVTKLKAAVNNKNLPILGNDGNLYNYYVGRYQNKMSELGYSLTGAEIQALNTFVENGINNGWIDKVSYFMPLIGSQTTPLTGIVPLIDNVANYELAVNSVNTEAFAYNLNGKIIGFKGVDLIKLPVKTSDLGDNSFSIFVDMLLDSTNISSPIRIFTAKNSNGVIMAQHRRQYLSNGKKQFSISTRTQETDEITDSVIAGNITDITGEVSHFYSVYYNADVLSTMTKRYTKIKISGEELYPDMAGLISSRPYNIGENIFYIGPGNSQNTTEMMKIMCLFNPKYLTLTDIRQFSDSVFTLTTALGK